jgi:hypothetical protein
MAADRKDSHYIPWLLAFDSLSAGRRFTGGLLGSGCFWNMEDALMYRSSFKRQRSIR